MVDKCCFIITIVCISAVQNVEVFLLNEVTRQLAFVAADTFDVGLVCLRPCVQNVHVSDFVLCLHMPVVQSGKYGMTLLLLSRTYDLNMKKQILFFALCICCYC